ncbi:DUF1844 domain-containing protein [Fundidesulfovibrio terrae]|uniref:DUF1844 domain-containing protein n=1 Tax=Fundidesulfovibrio terrae TaxID=2922866 RepID=UPI001FAF7242|nr:DUF1844 domain-containing protein [Fundidesulfovibrio terrae]
MNQDNKCGDCPDGQADYAGICLPQVEFTTFVYSLASAAMVHLGEMPEPESGQVAVNIPLAKHTIDTLAMLEEKTKGNLTADEAKQVADILGHLRMLCVRKNG